MSASRKPRTIVKLKRTASLRTSSTMCIDNRLVGESRCISRTMERFEDTEDRYRKEVPSDETLTVVVSFTRRFMSSLHSSLASAIPGHKSKSKVPFEQVALSHS